MPTSSSAKTRVLFEPGQLRWWAGGVITAAVFLALTVPFVLPKLTNASLWFLALGSAACFLSCFDYGGNFRPLRFVVVAFMLVAMYPFMPSVHTTFPPKLVLVLIVAVVLFVYTAAGVLGVAIGKAWTSDRPSKPSDT
jgi:peptidoglycan/LPS O-acetylase OafA/YrhL